MTSATLLNGIADYLRPKVVAAGGVFALSETVAQTIAALQTGPGKFRVVLQWQRESKTENRGEREMTFLAIVQQGVSLGIKSGDTVSVQRPGPLSGVTADQETPTADNVTTVLNSDPLLQCCTRVVNWLRALKLTNTDIIQRFPTCELGGAYWLNDPSFPTRQIAHEFTVRFALDLTTAEEVAL